ncbi:MAG: hypothetical protein ABL962_19815, partial [Fimbriimonadaceae bacterium]
EWRMRIFWSQRRFCQYKLGPSGWSGDGSLGSTSLESDFFGIRSDVYPLKDKILGAYALRHEVQHELQRCIYRITDRLATMHPQIRVAAERDANEAGIRYLRFKKLHRFWHPYCWMWPGRLGAVFSALSQLHQKIAVGMVLVLVFVVCSAILFLPSKGMQGCSLFLITIGGVILALRVSR